ncbi:hypothetical protein HGRIS_007744 [Hohenbuehelia grisea]|uniref:Uncharacterized protein n=1 Tax=Hohenbuehelia grisea TaxID=104357 RepID=A0ABR3J5U9_9AGAR
MPVSEIDDIFASKGKAKALPPPSHPPPEKTQKRKRDKKKRSKDEVDNVPASKKRPPPETVVDPSVPATKRPKTDKPPQAESSKQRTSTQAVKRSDVDDRERFKDSRGMGPRRQTEEGWNVYKEDELGISTEGGGKSSPLQRLCKGPSSPEQIPRFARSTVNVCLRILFWFTVIFKVSLRTELNHVRDEVKDDQERILCRFLGLRGIEIDLRFDVLRLW